MVERIEGLLGKIPGYRAYNEKESMRDDDRRVRDQIADVLTRAVSDLTAVSSTLASTRQLGAIGVIEDLVRDTRLLSDRVRTASYGYAGLFSDAPVDEFALAQLKAFDVSFEKRANTFAEAISSISSTADMDDSRIRDVSSQLDALDRLFDARGEVISTSKPATDSSILSLLETPVTRSDKEEQLLRLRDGATLSILGDNFQATGHIVLTSTDEVVLSLLRLDDGTSWLALVADGPVTGWRVAETTSASPLAHEPADARASVSGPQGTQDNVPAKYDVAVSSGESPEVDIRIAIGLETRTFAGPSVPLIDIEVFGERSSS